MLTMNPCINLAGDLASALSPVTFQQRSLAKVLPSLDQWQTEACGVNAPNLLLLCGRQTGKSTFAALLATWMVTTWPDSLVLLISPTLRQSTELFRKCMTLFDGHAGAPGVKARSKTELVLKNKSSIVSLPGANPDAIRGYSAPDLVIEDEAAFVNDRTFVAYRPMLATNPHGRNVLLTTPYGRRGHFYERWVSDDPDWARFAIKSDQCERILPSFLDGEKRVLSDRAFRQEYLCEFLEAANAVFPADLIERLTDNDERKTLLPDEVPLSGAEQDEANPPTGEEMVQRVKSLMFESGLYEDQAPPAEAQSTQPKANWRELLGQQWELTNELRKVEADETGDSTQHENRIVHLKRQIAELERHPDFLRAGQDRSEPPGEGERGMDLRKINIPSDEYADF